MKRRSFRIFSGFSLPIIEEEMNAFVDGRNIEVLTLSTSVSPTDRGPDGIKGIYSVYICTIYFEENVELKTE